MNFTWGLLAPTIIDIRGADTLRPLADIHIHMLPGLDDGADSWKTTARMLRMAYDDGTRDILFTPHHRRRQFREPVERLFDVFGEFMDRFADRYYDVGFSLGTEAYYENDLPEELYGGTVLTLAESRYVLSEYSTHTEYSYIRNSVNALSQYNYIPILAHIERYECLRGSWERLEELKDLGALFQINADSVLGNNGHGTKRFCKQILKEGMVSFIASDAHNTEHRAPLLRECSDYVLKKYGKDYERKLFWENAQAVIENETM